MNLIFRLLKTLLRYLLFPKGMDILGESSIHFRCWPNDLDTNLHMNNGRYMTLLDLGRLDLLLRTGAAKPAFRKKWYPVLAAAQFRYRKPLNLFQRFEIRTRIVGWDEKWVYIEQKMLRKGKVVTHALLKGAFVGPEGTVPISKLVALLGRTEPPPPLPQAFQAWLRVEETMAEGTRSASGWVA